MGSLSGMGSLNGVAVIVTGASRGIGRAVAIACAREGARVAICARGSEALEETAAAARSAGGEVLAVTADVSSARDVERLVALTLDRFGRVDALVNNASSLGPAPLPLLADAPVDALDEVMSVNVKGPLRLIQAVLGDMLLRGSGLIVNVTSDAAIEGYPGWGIYAASKAALEALTRNLAVELAGTGVRFVALDPGEVDTVMHRAADPDADPTTLERPEHVAEAFVRLVSAGAGSEGVRVTAASLR